MVEYNHYGVRSPSISGEHKYEDKLSKVVDALVLTALYSCFRRICRIMTGVKENAAP